MSTLVPCYATYQTYFYEKYDQMVQQAFVREVDSLIHKLNSTFQQDLKDESEAESIFIA